jgi:hypothetical protein
MRGQYITTTIMMAALSGSKARKSTGVKETLAVTNDHKIIWSKNTNQKNTAVVSKTKATLAC